MTWLDIFFVAVCIAAVVRGLMTGFVLQVTSLAGIILGAIFCGKVAEFIYPQIVGFIGNSPNITSAISYILGFIIILIAVNLVGRLVNKVADSIVLKPINRTAGAVFCLIKWIFIVSILFNLLIQMDDRQSIVKKEVRENSHTYPILTNVAQSIIPYLRFNEFTDPPKQDNQSPQEVFV